MAGCEPDDHAEGRDGPGQDRAEEDEPARRRTSDQERGGGPGPKPPRRADQEAAEECADGEGGGAEVRERFLVRSHVAMRHALKTRHRGERYGP